MKRGYAGRPMRETTAHPLLQELRAIRRAQGISQSVLAKKAGYAKQTVEKAETGRTAWGALQFPDDLAGALGYRVKWTLEKIEAAE